MQNTNKSRTALCILAISALMLGCGTTTSNAVHSSATPAKNVSVLYAGSMTMVMEQKIKPDFDANMHNTFEGEGKGSSALANMMKAGLANPDVFISASPSVNTKLLMGKENHQLVNWFVTIAGDELVIAYSPKSQFKNKLDAAKNGTASWYQALETPGIHIGRTDPELDPKGVNTIFMFELAEHYYHKDGLAKQILGSDNNPNQVFPEESLLAQLTSGQIDAVIAYKHEAVEWGVPYITLPDEVNLGNMKDASLYRGVSYTSKSGKKQKGAPIIFTATIPSHAQNKAGALSFLQYMIAGKGHDMLMEDGFTPIGIQIAGDETSLPASLKSYITGTFPTH